MSSTGVSKGLAYTTFALLSSSLILMMVSTQVMSPYETGSADAERIGEASFFLESTFSDLDRTLGIATRRAVTATTNYVVTDGEPLQSSEENVSEVLVNGSLDGDKLDGTENASLNDWVSRVSDIASRSGYELGMELENYSFQADGFEIKSSFAVSARLEDPVTLVSFNQTGSTETSTTIDEIEDSMITLRSRGRYVSQYNDCGFSEPGIHLYTGSQNSPGHTHGYAELMPEDIADVEDTGSKILVVEDIDSYEASEVNEYAGAVSSQQSDSPGSFSNYYVFGTGTIEDISQDTSLVLNGEEVWDTYFREMFLEDCYVTVDRGPDFFDRMENRVVGQQGETGLATLIDVSRLPQELRKQGSAVGYVYFNESGGYGSLNQVKGVSDDYPWFYLDDYHADYWDIEGLIQ